jgi:ubiquinone/menaquinone biosynthesis C-methylase UbiE
MHRRTVFDELAHCYDETRGGAERGYEFAATLRPTLQPPIVEVGVGTGAVAAGIAEADLPVVGVDISRQMLRRAHERLGSRVAVADAALLPVRRHSMGTALLVWVLQLVPDVEAVLRECRETVRRDGRVVTLLSDPVLEPPNDIDGVGAAIFSITHPEPRPGSQESVRKAAAEAGLQLVRRSFTSLQAWERTPNEEADHFDRRVYSSLVDVDEARWRTDIAPLVERMRSLPEPDRPRVMSHRQPILEFSPL